MEHVDAESSVPDWLIEYPVLLALFERLGIDYSCGGKSLAAACREQGLSVSDVLTQCEAMLRDGSIRA